MRFHLLTLIAVGWFLVLFGTGCPRSGKTVSPPESTTIKLPTPGSKSSPEGRPVSDKTPHQILEAMVAAYQSATSYSDHGIVQIVGQMSEPGMEPVYWPCSVAFQSPTKLRLDVNDGKLVSDGVNVLAQARFFVGQVLHFAPPKRWTLDVLFQDVNLDDAMNLGIPKDILAFPPQLVLLFAADPLKTFLPEGAVAEVLSQQPLNQSVCDLVQITHRERKRILWIRRDTGALVRLEYFVEGLSLPQGVESIRSIRVEMHDAAFNAPIPDETFVMLLPEGVKRVNALKTTESAFLGQTLNEPQKKIAVSSLPLRDGDRRETLTLGKLAEKTSVFCLWTTQSEASRAALEELQKVGKTFAEDDRVRFFAVDFDGFHQQRTATGDTEADPASLIRTVFDRWEISLPVYRPDDNSFQELFTLDSFPLFLIVGPDGCIELFTRTAVSAAMLGKTVRDILSGGKPHKEGLAMLDQERDDHRKLLATLVNNDYFAYVPPSDEHAPPSTPPSQRLPQTLTLKESWTLNSLQSPGNVAILPGVDNAPPQLLIPCNGNSLAVVSLAGNVLRNEKPTGLKSDELLTVVRTGVDGIQKRYIGVSSVSGRAIHVLNDSFQTILTYDPNKKSDKESETKEGVVADFLLGDVLGNGTQSVLLGVLSPDAAALDSVRLVDLQGKELWRDETIVSPFQVELYSRDGKLEVFATHLNQRFNTIQRYDTQGKQLGQLTAKGDYSIDQFNCVDLDGDGSSEICALLQSTTKDETLAAGLDLQGNVLWNVPLPAGEKSQRFEQIVAGDVHGDGVQEWIVVAADGSLFFIDASGKLIDVFATGRMVKGVAALTWEKRRMLVIADTNSITAWDVPARPGP